MASEPPNRARAVTKSLNPKPPAPTSGASFRWVVPERLRLQDPVPVPPGVESPVAASPLNVEGRSTLPLAKAAEEYNEAATALSSAIREFEATLNKHAAQVPATVSSDPISLDEFAYDVVRLRWERVKSGEWRIHRSVIRSIDDTDESSLMEDKLLGDCSIEQRIDAAPLLKRLAEALVVGMRSRTLQIKDAVQSLRGIVDEMGGL
jgi:hypothetical protein